MNSYGEERAKVNLKWYCWWTHFYTNMVNVMWMFHTFLETFTSLCSFLDCFWIPLVFHGRLNQKFGFHCCLYKVVFDPSARHLDGTRGQVHDEYSHVTCLQVYLSVCWTYVYSMYGFNSKLFSIQSACSGQKNTLCKAGDVMSNFNLAWTSNHVVCCIFLSMALALRNIPKLHWNSKAQP